MADEGMNGGAEMAGDAAESALNAVGDAAGDAAEWARTDGAAGASTAAGAAMGAASTAGGAIASGASAAGSGAQAAGSAAAGAAGSAAEWARTDGAAGASAAAGAAMGAASAAGSAAASGAQAAGSAVASGAQAAGSAAAGAAGTAADWARTDGVAGASAVGGAAMGAASTAGGAIASGASAAGSAASAAGSAAAPHLKAAGAVAAAGGATAAVMAASAANSAGQIASGGVEQLNTFLESDFVANVRQNVAFPSVGDVYQTTTDNLASLIRVMEGIGGISLGALAVLFDIFRDFFQILGLFFGGIELPSSFKNFWGNISNIIAFDLEVSLPDFNPIVYYYATFIVAVTMFGFLWTRSRHDPDSIRDGEEHVDWDERGSGSRRISQFLLTALITLYLPVSRNAVQVIVCADKYEPHMTCGEGSGWLHLVVGLFSIGLMTIYLPVFVYGLIQDNKPEAVEFDSLGNAKEYTNEDYRHDLALDKAPYKFIYSGYERDWAHYKVIVMGVKFLLILPIIVLPKLTDSNIISAIVINLVLGVYTILSFRSSPFIRSTEDRVDQSARLATLSTSVLAYIEFNDSAKGLTLNIIHWVNITFMIMFTILGIPALRRKAKSVFGWLDFTDDMKYDLNRERRVRIWHSFWDTLFIMSQPQIDPETKELGSAPYPDCNLDEATVRLYELKEIATKVGVKDYTGALTVISPEVSRERMWVQMNLEGWDTYSDLTPEDGHLDSKTCFAKCYIVPFPYHVVLVYDDSDDFTFVQDKDFMTFCAKNRDPEIQRRRHVRRCIRAMNDKQVYFRHTETHSKEVGSGDNRKTVQVLFTFERGTVHVKLNKKNEWSAGFKVSMRFSDGVGSYKSNTGANRKTWTNESATINAKQMGLTYTYEQNASLSRLLSHEENVPVIEENLKTIQSKLIQYRKGLFEKRVQKAKTLSYAFWARVYNNDSIPRPTLERFLSEVETNPNVKSISSVHSAGLDYVFQQLAFFNSHPAVAFWFTFFHDLFNSNNSVKWIESNPELFDPRNPTALIYHPCSRPQLEKKLIDAELRTTSGGGKFNNKLLDKMFTNMQLACSESGDFFTGGVAGGVLAGSRSMETSAEAAKYAGDASGGPADGSGNVGTTNKARSGMGAANALV